MTRLILAAALLALSACSGADLMRACEDVEPFRPIIRDAITVVEPIAAIPFAVTRNIHCSDIREVK